MATPFISRLVQGLLAGSLMCSALPAVAASANQSLPALDLPSLRGSESEKDTETLTPVSSLQAMPAAPSTGEQPVNLSPGSHNGEGLDEHSVETLQQEKLPPVVYTPVAGILVLPIVKLTQQQVFSDAGFLAANRLARTLQTSLHSQGTRVFSPLETLEDIEELGLTSVYEKVADVYLQSGEPPEKPLAYLLDKLGYMKRYAGKNGEGKGNNVGIERVVFVEAYVDPFQGAKPVGVLEKLKAIGTDAIPKQFNYLYKVRATAYQTADNTQPPVYMWSQVQTQRMKGDGIFHLTPSVYQDSNTQFLFSRASEAMSQNLVWLMPQTVYQNADGTPQQTVQGKILSASEAAAKMSLQDQEAVKQVIRRLTAF